MAEPTSTRPGGAPRRGSPRSRGILLVLAGLLSLVLAAGSGAAIAGIRYFESNLNKVESGPHCTAKDCISALQSHQECEQQVCTFLVLGSDSRTGLTPDQQKAIGTDPTTVTGQRADTIILVHVDPVHGRTVVMNVPRDLLVDIPGHDRNKINSAFSYGPNVMVRTLEQLTGFTINHYVAINFAGFEKLVSALGGIPICIDKPMIDTLAGLKLPHAGCYDLKGVQALAFVRARHVEGDAIPDFSRIARQQQFMRVVIDKLLGTRIVMGGFTGIVNSMKDNLVIDDGLNLYDLQGLVRRLSGLGQGGVDFRVVPATPVAINGVDYVEAIQPQANQLFARIRLGKPLGGLGQVQTGTPPSPATVSVHVFDAGSGGAASRVAEYLRRAGFQVVGVDGAPAGLTASAVVYRTKFDAQKNVVASYLPKFPTKAVADYVIGAQVGVVVGPDFPGLPA